MTKNGKRKRGPSGSRNSSGSIQAVPKEHQEILDTLAAVFAQREEMLNVLLDYISEAHKKHFEEWKKICEEWKKEFERARAETQAVFDRYLKMVEKICKKLEERAARQQEEIRQDKGGGCPAPGEAE